VDDAALLQTIARRGFGVTGATAKLYDRYQDKLLRFFQAAVETSQAWDLLQDTFIKIVERAPAMKNFDNPSAWIWRIAHNVRNDYFRSANKLLSFEEVYENTDPTAEDTNAGFYVEFKERKTPAVSVMCAPDQDVIDCVKKALERFSVDHPHRFLVIEWLQEGESPQEIATRLNRTVGATYEFISQCKKKLQPYTQPCKELAFG